MITPLQGVVQAESAPRFTVFVLQRPDVAFLNEQPRDERAEKTLDFSSSDHLKQVEMPLVSKLPKLDTNFSDRENHGCAAGCRAAGCRAAGGIMLSRSPVRLVIDDEERPHRPPRLREDAQLLVGQVTDNGHLRVGPGRG